MCQWFSKGLFLPPGTVPGQVPLKLKWGFVQFSLKNLPMGPVKLEDITAVAVSQSLRVPLLGSFPASGFLTSLQRHGKWLLHTTQACLRPSVQTEPEYLSASQL